MHLKIMSDEEIPDEDSRKCFTIIDRVREVSCGRIVDTEENRARLADENEGSNVKGYIGGPIIEAMVLDSGEPEIFRLVPAGNVYVLNDDGMLLSSFGVAPYVEAEDEGQPFHASVGPAGITGL